MFRNHSSSLHNLEIQMGQLANSLSIRNQGLLLSNNEKNPTEYVKAITLKSEKQLQSPKRSDNIQRRRKRRKNKKMSGLKYKWRRSKKLKSRI